MNLNIDHQVKHLEMIQAVKTRLAQNSFAIKGWTITIVAAILILAEKVVGWQFLIFALLPNLVFWGLDAYYLRQEKLFRALYNNIRSLSTSEWSNNPFTMKTSPFSQDVSSWWRVVWSKTIGWLYGITAMLIIGLAIMHFILNKCIGIE